jgi:hypothetical protein
MDVNAGPKDFMFISVTNLENTERAVFYNAS